MSPNLQQFTAHFTYACSSDIPMAALDPVMTTTPPFPPLLEIPMPTSPHTLEFCNNTDTPRPSHFEPVRLKYKLRSITLSTKQYQQNKHKHIKSKIRRMLRISHQFSNILDIYAKYEGKVINSDH